MSGAAQFFALAAIEVTGLFAIWFFIKLKVRRYLELENLLAGVRDEARSLVLELNETADRNVTLVEDRIAALRELLDEVDRRIGVEKKELDIRATEREVYAKLSKRRPIVPAPSQEPVLEPPRPAQDVPITLNLGPAAAVAPETRAQGASSNSSAGRAGPEVVLSDDFIVPSRTKREEALDLYRRGISADLIAARLGATVAEIELLIEIEERRTAGIGRAL
jgi:hypothetical protein